MENALSQQAPFRVSGLDTIRFICALTVVMGHISLPPFQVSPHDHMLRGLGLIYAHLFNGPAAVIAFFVISGFCIHFPQASRQRTRVAPMPFYVRRLARLLPPSLCAILLYKLSGASFEYPVFGVLWSIICEGIYYLLYPMLLPASARFGWARMAGLGYIVALIAAITHLPLLVAENNGYGAFGLWTWIVGLPVWLSGCWLAENWHRFATPSARRINLIRIGIFALSFVLRAVKFHVPPPWGSNVIWLNLFAFAVVFWLGCEIAYRRVHAAPARLEWAGQWSYSLYLVHPAVAAFIVAWAGGPSTPATIVAILSSLIIAYIFFLVVERPSHMLAMSLGRRWPAVVPARAPV